MFPWKIPSSGSHSSFCSSAFSLLPANTTITLFSLSFLVPLTFLLQGNWEAEVTEGLKLGTEEPLPSCVCPSVPGVTKQHPVAVLESWDAPTNLRSQDRILERQNLGVGEYLLTSIATVAFALLAAANSPGRCQEHKDTSAPTIPLINPWERRCLTR